MARPTKLQPPISAGRKYRACDATSAHWYSLEQIERYAGALIARDQERGRAGREKTTVQGFHCPVPGHERDQQAEAGSARTRSGAYVAVPVLRLRNQGQSPAHGKIAGSVAAHTRPVRPELLGVIGEEHLRRLIEDAGGEPASFKYFAKPGVANGVPVHGRDRTLSIQAMGRWRNCKGPGADHRCQFQRHAGESVRHIKGHGRDGETSWPSYAPGNTHRSSFASTTPPRTSNIWIAARAASAWSKDHGCRRRHKKRANRKSRNFTKQRKAEEKQSSNLAMAQVTDGRSPRQVSDRGRQRGLASMLHEGFGQRPICRPQRDKIYYVARPLFENLTDKSLLYGYFSQTLLPDYIKGNGETGMLSMTIVDISRSRTASG